MYEGIHHVSVLVTNLKESLYFYEGILGFKQIKNALSLIFRAFGMILGILNCI